MKHTSIALFLLLFITQLAWATPCENLTISESFTNGGLGQFTSVSVMGTRNWYSKDSYGAYISGYVNSTNTETEAWLISPALDLSGMVSAKVAFSHAINFGADYMSTNNTVWATTHYTGDPSTTTWQPLTVSQYPNGNSWTYVNANLDLAAFIGNNDVRFAFKYISTTTSASTWEIRNLTITLICAETDTPEPAPDDNEWVALLAGKTSTQILTTLHNAIKDHVVFGYSDIRADKTKIDLRADGSVWDMYSDCSFSKTNYCGSGSDFPECNCYNREHVVPKSFWGYSSSNPGDMYTDLFNVIPTDFVANTQRSAWSYGNVTGTPTWSNGLGSKLGYSSAIGKTVFEPVDAYKGDIARIYFYMLTCYLDQNFTAGGQGYQDFTYANNTAGFTQKFLNILLAWHRQDPISQKEKDRNERIATLQHNRNPYVDAPELVEYIWGDKKGQAYHGTTAITSTTLSDLNEPLYIYTSTGVLLYHGMSSEMNITLPAGIYLFVTATGTQKVLVR